MHLEGACGSQHTFQNQGTKQNSQNALIWLHSNGTFLLLPVSDPSCMFDSA
jgi:hypothetical protein